MRNALAIAAFELVGEAFYGSRDHALVFPQARQQLTDEPEAEERDAADDQDHDEVEEWAEAVVEDIALDEGHNPHEEPSDKEQRAGNAKEQHRLPAKPELKPHGQKIHHAHRNPPDAKLGLPRAPGL